MAVNMITSNTNNNNVVVDTSLTKVFVGGLAWETPKEALRNHFDKFGDIVEAVIISDKITARSKGYGFVTFKNADAANKACVDPTPTINGRRANCNLAALGARRPRSASNISPPPQQPPVTTVAPPQNNVHWYYRPAAAAPFHHQAVPFYGYSPTYIAAADVNYNHVGRKMGYGHFGYPGQAMVSANHMMPMYPFYHFNQSHAMGLPAQVYSLPLMPNKPTSIAHSPTNSAAVCLAVE